MGYFSKTVLAAMRDELEKIAIAKMVDKYVQEVISASEDSDIEKVAYYGGGIQRSKRTTVTSTPAATKGTPNPKPITKDTRTTNPYTSPMKEGPIGALGGKIQGAMDKQHAMETAKVDLRKQDVRNLTKDMGSVVPGSVADLTQKAHKRSPLIAAMAGGSLFPNQQKRTMGVGSSLSDMPTRSSRSVSMPGPGTMSFMASKALFGSKPKLKAPSVKAQSAPKPPDTAPKPAAPKPPVIKPAIAKPPAVKAKPPAAVKPIVKPAVKPAASGVTPVNAKPPTSPTGPKVPTNPSATPGLPKPAAGSGTGTNTGQGMPTVKTPPVTMAVTARPMPVPKMSTGPVPQMSTGAVPKMSTGAVPQMSTGVGGAKGKSVSTGAPSSAGGPPSQISRMKEMAGRLSATGKGIRQDKAHVGAHRENLPREDVQSAIATAGGNTGGAPSSAKGSKFTPATQADRNEFEALQKRVATEQKDYGTGVEGQLKGEHTRIKTDRQARADKALGRLPGVDQTPASDSQLGLFKAISGSRRSYAPGSNMEKNMGRHSTGYESGDPNSFRVLQGISNMFQGDPKKIHGFLSQHGDQDPSKYGKPRAWDGKKLEPAQVQALVQTVTGGDGGSATQNALKTLYQSGNVDALQGMLKLPQAQ